MYPERLKTELETRWMAIREAMRESGADGLLISTNANLYYASGRVFSGFVYFDAATATEPLFFVRRPVGLHGAKTVYIRKPEEIADRLREYGTALPETLLLETDAISYNEYLRYEKIFTPRTVKNGSRLLRGVRSIKTPYEIERLKTSGIRHTEVYRQIPSLYKPGMTDLELSVEIERACRLHGSLGIFRIFGQSMEIFMGSVIAGENADTPSPYDFAMGGGGLDTSLPVGCDGTPLREGMSVMVDLGGNFTGYMTDMTRTFSVGALTDLAYKAHETSIEIQKRMETMARPGTPAADLYNMAAETAAEADLSDYFMGHRQKAGFVGHGIGIEINEAPVLAPRSRDLLKEGMVFALEPKFVIPGVGAVGIENSFAVTRTGVEKLTLCEERIIPLE